MRGERVCAARSSHCRRARHLAGFPQVLRVLARECPHEFAVPISPVRPSQPPPLARSLVIARPPVYPRRTLPGGVIVPLRRPRVALAGRCTRGSDRVQHRATILFRVQRRSHGIPCPRRLVARLPRSVRSHADDVEGKEPSASISIAAITAAAPRRRRPRVCPESDERERAPNANVRRPIILALLRTIVPRGGVRRGRETEERRMARRRAA